MPTIYSLNALNACPDHELLALYADLSFLLSDPVLTNADRLAVQTVLGNIRLVLHRRRQRHYLGPH